MKLRVLFIAMSMLAGFLMAAPNDDGIGCKTKEQPTMNNTPDTKANVRYMVDDVAVAIDFYTKYLGFTVESDSSPAFAAVTRGNLRLLLSGEKKLGPTTSGRWHQSGTGRLESD
jgi:hypothetical protein